MARATLALRPCAPPRLGVARGQLHGPEALQVPIAEAAAQVVHLGGDDLPPGPQGPGEALQVPRQLLGAHALVGRAAGAEVQLQLRRQRLRLGELVVVELREPRLRGGAVALHARAPPQRGHLEPRKVPDAARGQPRDVVGAVVQEHEQALVHLPLEVRQRQVVVVVAEGVLQFPSDKVQEKHAEDGHEGEDGWPHYALEQHREHRWDQQRVEEQEQRQELRVGEGEARVRDLPRVQQADVAPRERLVHAREDGGRDLQDIVVQGLVDERLEDVQGHLDSVEAVLRVAVAQVLHRLLGDALEVDEIEGQVVARDLR
mmetsp:Transcript_4224/g.12799  ORF Transcript_4224/g.12799 Transcript_4224/m.12799 type:complete len:316 (+) Transcript_4224:86-1033(+)